MSAYDPKRTFRPQILTSIKFKVVAHELSSITVAYTTTVSALWTRDGIISSRAATFVFAA